MKEMIAFIQNIIDWLAEKAETKYGLAIIGFVFGLVTPLSYIYYQEKRIDTLIETVSEEKENLAEYKELAKEWEDRAFKSEQDHIQKTKEIIQLMNDLEQYYEERNKAQNDVNKNLTNYIHKLDKLLEEKKEDETTD